MYEKNRLEPEQSVTLRRVVLYLARKPICNEHNCSGEYIVSSAILMVFPNTLDKASITQIGRNSLTLLAPVYLGIDK